MRISILTFGAFTSILSLNAYASSVVTSQTYVDNADALKVNIAQGTGTNNANVGKTLVVNSQGNLELGTVDVPTLPEGTAGNVVTYDSNGDIGGEMEIYDGSDEYDSSTDADKLVSGSALETKQNLIKTEDSNWWDNYYWSGLTWAPDTKFVINNGGDVTGYQYALFDGYALDDFYDSQDGAANKLRNLVNDEDGDVVKLYTIPTTEVVGMAVEELWDGKQNKLVANNSTTNPNGSLVTYGTTAGTPGSKKIVTAVASGGTDIPTDGAVYSAVQTKQNKMTCTRWIDNAAHTDANCLLWNMAN